VDRAKKVLNLVFVGVGVLSCVLGCVVAQMFANWTPFTSETTDISLDDEATISLIEGNASFIFPPSATNINMKHEGFREIFVQTRFNMSADELPTFLDGTLCEQPPTTTDPSAQGESLDSLSWWRPMDAQTLLECSGVSETTHQRILFDTTDPDTYIVYVSAGTR
jgi:hypothetical protein